MSTTLRDLIRQVLREVLPALSLEDFQALKRRYQAPIEGQSLGQGQANTENRTVKQES